MLFLFLLFTDTLRSGRIVLIIYKGRMPHKNNSQEIMPNKEMNEVTDVPQAPKIDGGVKIVETHKNLTQNQNPNDREFLKVSRKKNKKK